MFDDIRMIDDQPTAIENLRSGGYLREARLLANAHAILCEIEARESVRTSTRNRITDLISEMEAGE